jgi:hypothetical protein
MKDIDIALGGKEGEGLTVCRITITGHLPNIEVDTFIDLSADQLQTFLLNAGAHRAKMEPAVPLKLDPGRPIFKDSTFSPATMVGSSQQITGKQPYLAIRHPGFGWLAFSFTIGEARDVMQLLAQTILHLNPDAARKGLILP